MNKNITIKIGNVNSRIFGFLSDDIMDELYDKLAFQKKNIEFSPKVIEGKWDGYRRLFDKYKKTFPTGLLSLVYEVLKDNNYKIELDDQRVLPEQNRHWKLILPENINSLYDFQQAAVHIAKKSSRGIFSIATGGGKTLTFAAIISDVQIAPVIIYVPSLLLLYQTKEEIEKFVRDKSGKNVEVGVVGDGKCEIKDITVMTIQTAITAFDMEYDKNKDVVRYLTSEQIQKKNEQLLKHKRVNNEDPDATEDLGFVVTRKEILKDLINNAKVIICDECFKGDSKVLMPNGEYETISKLVNMKYDGEVMSWNIKKEIMEPKKVIGHIRKKPLFPMVKIDVGDGLVCTNNHLILTNNGWRMAKDLKNNDLIISTDKNCIVKDISKLDNFDEDVYCLEVEDNHNFIVQSVVVHNCHRASSSIYQEVLKQSPLAYYRWAMSATAIREDNTEMLIQAIFGKILMHVPCSELIRRPDVRIIRPYIFMIDTPNYQNKNYQTYAQIRKNCIVESQQRNQLISNIAQYMQQYGPTLLLVGIIEHGKKLEKMIPGSVFISGQTAKKKKQQALKDLMSGDLKILIASPIIDEGLNLPGLKVLMLCDGGKAATKLYQRIGRVVREIPGKEYALVIDFKDKNDMLFKHSNKREKLYLLEDEWILTHVSADKFESKKG